MKKNVKTILSGITCAIVMCTFFGCNSKPTVDKKLSNQVKQEKKDESKSSFVKYATKFKVDNLDNNVKLVTDGSNRKLLLVPKGQDKPKGYDDAQVIKTPINNVLLCSTMQTSLIRPLDVFDTVGCVTKYDVNKGHIKEINDRMKKGKIAYVGKLSALDYELIRSKKPEVAFIIAVDEPKIGPKLKELGIPYVVEASSLEKHPLARMEWIKFMSLFYNKEDVANQYLQNAEEHVKKVEEKVKGKEKPLLTAGVSYKGKFSVRRGGSYQAKMYDIVGADYVFKDVGANKSGAASLTFEDFYAKSAKANIYIYDPSSTTPKNITDFVKKVPILENMKCIKDGQLWAAQPWWSQSIDKLDEIIEDLAAICHPEEFKDHEIKYYYKLQK